MYVHNYIYICVCIVCIGNLVKVDSLIYMYNCHSRENTLEELLRRPWLPMIYTGTGMNVRLKEAVTPNKTHLYIIFE